MQAPKCTNEEERLAALSSYNILDTEPEERYDEVTRLLSRACGTPISLITLVDRDRQWFKSEVGVGFNETPLESSICAHALLQDDLLIVPDTLEDARFADNALVAGEPGLRFYAGALLKTTEGYAIGTLCVLDYKPRELNEFQLDLLQVLAHQVTTQIELHRTVSNLEESIEKHKAVESQLNLLNEKNGRIADTLQRTMLIAPPADRFTGLKVKTLYKAALDEALVGGDFFDAFPINEHTTALVVGDVSGKGLGAAARTAEIKYALRAYLDAILSPEYTLEQLNDFICHMQEGRNDGGFIVITLAIIDGLTGEASIVTAGAEPGLILRADGGIDQVHHCCQPLGISPASYTSCSAVLNSGDTLILVTDGLTEARRGKEFLDIEGIASIAQNIGSNVDLECLANGIIDGARAFSGGPLRDDACLLLAKRI